MRQYRKCDDWIKIVVNPFSPLLISFFEQTRLLVNQDGT